jgi:hypothetical protein
LGQQRRHQLVDQAQDLPLQGLRRQAFDDNR